MTGRSHYRDSKGDRVMDWKKNCFAALDREKMFEDSGHRTRFRELFDCYCCYPFFTKGLCKCIYLSAWDEKHFCIMLETLTELSLGKERDTKEMSVKGDALIEEQTDNEYYIYLLSSALLNDTPYRAELPADLDSGTRYIIRRALRVSDIIDSL